MALPRDELLHLEDGAVLRQRQSVHGRLLASHDDRRWLLDLDEDEIVPDEDGIRGPVLHGSRLLPRRDACLADEEVVGAGGDDGREVVAAFVDDRGPELDALLHRLAIADESPIDDAVPELREDGLVLRLDPLVRAGRRGIGLSRDAGRAPVVLVDGSRGVDRSTAREVHDRVLDEGQDPGPGPDRRWDPGRDDRRSGGSPRNGSALARRTSREERDGYPRRDEKQPAPAHERRCSLNRLAAERRLIQIRGRMRKGDRDRRPRPKRPPRAEKCTVVPPFDPDAYARIVDATVIETAANAPLAPVVARDTPKTMTAAAPVMTITEGSEVETLARAMYASYLESNFPEALVLAEHVVDKQPDHALAHAVVNRCKAVLGDDEEERLQPSSVVRRKPGREAASLGVDARSLVVLAHIDGVIDAATVAQLAGMTRVETLEHLHALLDDGILEVVA